MPVAIQTFYSYFRSSTAYRLRIALNLKGVKPEFTRFIHLRKGEQKLPEYLAVNPMGAVPAFVLSDGTILTQSLAMLEWLEETYPSPALLPTDALLRARVRAFALTIATDMHPLNNLRVLEYLKTSLHQPQSEVTQWIHHWTQTAFTALEAQISATTPFCFGESPSLADICLVPQWYNAERFDVPLHSYPRLAQIVAHCRSLPAFADAAPEAQPDCDIYPSQLKS
jgi:maleylacetoacetate isomerase